MWPVDTGQKCPENIESGLNRDVLPPFGPKLCEVRATGLRMPVDPQMTHFAEKSAKNQGKRGFGALGPICALSGPSAALRCGVREAQFTLVESLS